MNDDARAKLARMIKTYGVQIASTPKSCEIFLKQHCGDHPEELAALTSALRQGMVDRILKYPASQPWEVFAAGLTRHLSRAGMRDDASAWVVNSWAMALGKHPSTVGSVETDRIPSEPPASGPAPSALRTLLGDVLVGLGGAAGAAAGVCFGIGILLGVSKVLPEHAPQRWISTSIDEHAHVHRLVGLLIVAGAAGLGGGLGGFFAWILGRGGAQLAWKGAIGAFVAAFFVAAVACSFSLDVDTLENLVFWDSKQMRFDLAVVPVGSLLAAMGAALSVAFKGTIR